MDLAAKVALVTGGASGLGEAAARELAAAGARVFVLDLAPNPASPFESIAADASDPAAAEAALARLPALHIAVNCAGIATAQRILGKEGPLPLDAFEKVIRVNLLGTFNVCRLAAARMAQNEPGPDGERGVIINTASIAAFEGQIGQCAYAASKGGVAALTLPMARDLMKLGIRVNAIAPGLFDTPLLQKLLEQVRNELGATIPFPSRLGHPPEFGKLVRHIAENAYLNGEIIRIDGALRMPPR